MAGGGFVVGDGQKAYPGKLTPFVLFTCVVAAMGGLIFGYDIGISGGVTSMPSFLRRFFPSVYEKQQEDATTNQYCQYDSPTLTLFTSSLYLAALISSLVASTVTRKFGRRLSMLFGGILFCVGALINGFAKHVWMLIVGRILLGFGIGFANQTDFMGQLVKLVVGVWEQVGQRGWLFLEDPTERRYEITVHENQTHASLMDLVRTRYSVGLATAVTLTYEFPEWMKAPGDILAPPVDVKDDGDVELFMSIRTDIPSTRLMVTIGNDVVARYLFLRREDYTVIGSSKGCLGAMDRYYPVNDGVNLDVPLLPVNAYREVPADGKGFWEGMLGQCFLSSSQQFLANVCSSEGVTLGDKDALGIMMNALGASMDSNVSSESSTDSSPGPEDTVPAALGGGILRLEDGKGAATGVPRNVLTIEEPRPTRKAGSLLEYMSKGKGRVCDEEEREKKSINDSGRVSPLMSNPNFPDPIPDADSTDEDTDDEGGSHLFVGQVFIDRSAFRTHMSLYALANKFRFLCRRSEPGKMVLVCRGNACKWRVSASKLPGCPQFQIKRLEEGHNCTVDERGDFKQHATSNLIGEMVRNKFGSGGSGPRPHALREFMRSDHHVPISYWKAWKSRELAKERGLGNTADAYKMLPSYLSKLALANPGTVAAIETTPGEGDIKRFKYLFLSFGASAKGYEYMRKVVIVDGTHLKGKYSGCLLTASAQDANYQIFPIAFAIVDGENDHSWSWFFQKLTAVVADAYELVFVSDRHSSIYAGLHKWYPMAKHYACVLHLQRNIVSMFKKKHLAYLVSKASRAYRVCDFYKHFNEIKMIDINCADYLIRIGFEHWARSHSSGMRYNIMTSNVAESLNAALSEARDYPIVALIEYIRGMVMRWFSVRREESEKCGGLVTPKVEELISRNFSVSTGFLVRHITKAEFEVRGKEGVPFCVDLDAKTCSCLEFDMLRIPCGHAVAAAIHTKRRVDVLVGDELSRNNWASGYSMSINPGGDDEAAPPVEDTLASLILAPPNTRRPPGRPKKTRILSRGEFKRGGVGRKKRTCKRCGGKDHNRATCKMPI